MKTKINLSLSILFFNLLSIGCINQKKNINANSLDLIWAIDIQEGFNQDTLNIQINETIISEERSVSTIPHSGFTGIKVEFYKGFKIPSFFLLSYPTGRKIIQSNDNSDSDIIKLRMQIIGKGFRDSIELDIDSKKYIGIAKKNINNNMSIGVRQQSTPYQYY